MVDSVLMQIDNSVTDGVEAGRLLWGSPGWLLPAVAIGIVLALLVIWNYAQASTLASVRVIAGLLKLTAIILLAICLLQPLRHAEMMRLLIEDDQALKVFVNVAEA